MSRIDTLNAIVRDYALADCDVYLFELIPLIEMMWADGRNQSTEMSILYRFALEHVAFLSKAADGEDVVSVDQVNAFLDRFAHHRPPEGLLRDLRRAVWGLLGEGSDDSGRQRRHTLLEYCMDIASACEEVCPCGSRGRFVEGEKGLIFELIEALELDPDRPVPL
jgi:hypothetical protein